MITTLTGQVNAISTMLEITMLTRLVIVDDTSPTDTKSIDLVEIDIIVLEGSMLTMFVIINMSLKIGMLLMRAHIWMCSFLLTAMVC